MIKTIRKALVKVIRKRNKKRFETLWGERLNNLEIPFDYRFGVVILKGQGFLAADVFKTIENNIRSEGFPILTKNCS